MLFCRYHHGQSPGSNSMRWKTQTPLPKKMPTPWRCSIASTRCQELKYSLRLEETVSKKDKKKKKNLAQANRSSAKVPQRNRIVYGNSPELGCPMIRNQLWVTVTRMLGIRWGTLAGSGSLRANDGCQGARVAGARVDKPATVSACAPGLKRRNSQQPSTANSVSFSQKMSAEKMPARRFA